MEPPVFSPFIFLSCKLRTIDCSTSVTLRIKPFIWQAGSPYRPGMKAFGLMKGWGLCLKHYTAVTAKVTTSVSVCKTLHTLTKQHLFFFFFGWIWGERLKCAWFSFQLLCCVICSQVWCNQCVRGALSVFTFRYCTWKYMNRAWNMCTVEPVLGSKRAY